MNESVDLVLITGFLGAGKTTFLRRLVSHAREKSALAVLINEFSDLPVDATLLNANEIATKNGIGEPCPPPPPQVRDGQSPSASFIQVVELSSGSIFCGCLKPDFIQALLELVKLPIATILVEGSGLADPAGINRLVAEASARAERPLVYRGAICLADATSFVELADTLVALERQVAASRCVLLNKADLADEAALAQAEAKIREFAPEAKIFRTVQADVDIPALLAAVTQSDYEGESSNTPENRPGAYVLSTQQSVNPQGLLRFLEAVSPSTWRIKGFLGELEVSAVQEQIEIRPMEMGSEARQGLAVIAKDTRDLRPLLRKNWERFVGTPLSISPEKPGLAQLFSPRKAKRNG